MATYTENYNLEKPAQSDLYNVDVFNENADKIDEALGDKAENQSLAPIESSSTASRNYSVGQQFVYNGLLYEATAAIASGGTITPGSNCARTTVAEELSALNDSLNNLSSVGVNGTITMESDFTLRNGSYAIRYGNWFEVRLHVYLANTITTRTKIATVQFAGKRTNDIYRSVGGMAVTQDNLLNGTITGYITSSQAPVIFIGDYISTPNPKEVEIYFRGYLSDV